MNSADILTLNNKQAIFVSADKVVESVTYTDGSCDLFLDLTHETLSVLHKLAHERECSIDEVIIEALETFIDSEEKEDTFDSWRKEDEDSYYEVDWDDESEEVKSDTKLYDDLYDDLEEDDLEKFEQERLCCSGKCRKNKESFFQKARRVLGGK